MVEILPSSSIDNQEFDALGVSQPNCMTPYFDYLLNGILPNNDIEARKIKIKSPQTPFMIEHYTEKAIGGHG